MDKTNIGTEGWQGQWTVPYNDDIEFVIELTSTDQAIVTVKIDWTGTDVSPQQGGGFDPLPIVAVVVVLIVVFVSVLLIVRMRKQTPLPPPPEESPPPPA